MIQRARIKRPFVETVSLSSSVAFDYMGSAEFEFGALPCSLHRMKETAFAYSLRTVRSISQDDSWLRVYSRYDQDEFNQYLQYLYDLREDKIRLKEWSGFYKIKTTGYSPDFWWDIENDVMWTFEKQYAKRLPTFLQKSFEIIS